MNDDTHKTIPEGQFAEELGLPAERLRNLRREILTSEDYVQKGRALHLLESGRFKVMEHLGLNPEVATPAVEYATLEVKRTVTNPRLVLGCIQGAPLMVVRCRVQDSSKFIPGMLLKKCRRVADVSEVNQCVAILTDLIHEALSEISKYDSRTVVARYLKQQIEPEQEQDDENDDS